MAKSEQKSGYETILSLFTKDRDLIVSATVYGVMIGVLTLIVPVSAQALVNIVAFTSLAQPLVVLTVLVLLVMGVSSLLKAYQTLAVESIQQHIYARMTIIVASTFARVTDTDEKKPFETSSKFLEIHSLTKNFSFLFIDGLGLVMQIFIGLILLAFYHPFFLVLDVVLIVLTYLLFKSTLQKAKEFAIEKSDTKYKVAAALDSVLTQNQSQNIEQKVQSVDELSYKHILARRGYFKWYFYQIIGLLILQLVAAALLFGIGGLLVIKGQLSLGQLVAAELIITMLIASFVNFGKYISSYYDFYVAHAKLAKILNLQVDQTIPAANTETSQVVRLSKHWVTIPVTKKVFVSMFVLFVAILTLTPWQQTSRGDGRVIAYSPSDRQQTIDAPIEGRVIDWKVYEGSHVKEGEIIVELTDNDPEILSRLDVEKNAVMARLKAAKLAVESSQANVVRQKTLFEQGLSSKRAYELAQIELAKNISDETNAQAELSRIEVRFARQSNLSVRAPRDGIILRRMLGVGSKLVKMGEPLAVFIPHTDSRAVELWVDGNDLPLMEEGRKVRLQFEGWPAIQASGWPAIAIGTFPGVVSLVDAADSGHGKFRVLITPEPDSKWPDPKILRQGIRVQGWVLLERVRLGYEIWRRFNGFPPIMDNALLQLKDTNMMIPDLGISTDNKTGNKK